MKKLISGIFLFLLSGCFVFFTSEAYSQSKEEIRILRDIQKYYDNAEYEKVLSLYEEIVKMNPDNFDYRYELALIYFHELNQKGKSIPHFLEAKSIMRQDSVPELFYLLGQAYQADGQYEKAIETYHYYRDIDSSFIKVNTRRYVDMCNYGIELLNNPDQNIQIANIGPTINSDDHEYTALFIPGSNHLLFTSRRHTNMFDELIEAIYVSSYNGDSYENVRKADETLKYMEFVIDDEEHSSVVSISKDYNLIILYAASYLYTTEFDGNEWQTPKRMDKHINFNFSNRHASMTADRSEVYFSSFDWRDQNNIDIFYCKKLDDGSWSEAQLLEGPVNTRKNEDSPEISAQGDTLYFSSNGHKGMGGYDVFFSVKKDSAWSEPQNMGSPVNSPWNDIYYRYDQQLQQGFLSSDRKGGFGKMDIYVIRRKDQ